MSMARLSWFSLAVLIVPLPAAHAQSAGFSPGYGFWIGDGSHAAYLRTSLQPRYVCVSDPDGDVPCDPNGFVLRRARVRIGAQVRQPGADIVLQADLADLDQPLEEAYAAIRPRPELAFSAGRMRVPFTREGLYEEERLPLGDVSALTALVQPPRDLGASFTGRLGPFGLMLGLWNGSPELFENDNVDLLYAQRAQIELIDLVRPWSWVRPIDVPPGRGPSEDRLQVSLGAASIFELAESGTDTAGDPANAAVEAFAVDLAVRAPWIDVDAAAALRETDRGALEVATDVVRESGLTSTVAVRVPPLRLVPAARIVLVREEAADGRLVDGWQIGAGAAWSTGAADLLTIVGEYSLGHKEGEKDVHRGLLELRIVL